METRRYRVGLDLRQHYRRTAIACVSCLLLGAGAVLGFGYAYFYDHDEKLVAEYENQLQTKDEQHEKEVESYTQAMTDAAVAAAQREANIQEQYDELQRIHQEVIEQSAADFAILRKYWYVLRDGPNNGTLTLDLFRFADNKCKEWNINPHWVWHMYEHESQWIVTEVNGGSGATGIGQAMPSTGKVYWEDIMGHGAGSFSTEMLKDPYVNIEITVAHLGRDLQNGATWREAVAHYCGGGVDAYWNTVVRMAAEHGITLTENNYQYQ